MRRALRSGSVWVIPLFPLIHPLEAVEAFLVVRGSHLGGQSTRAKADYIEREGQYERASCEWCTPRLRAMSYSPMFLRQDRDTTYHPARWVKSRGSDGAGA